MILFLFYKGKRIMKKWQEENKVFPSYKMCFSFFKPLLFPKFIASSSLIYFQQSRMLWEC